MNFFRLIFLVLIVITFSQKVMSDSHDQNIVEKAKEINKQVKEKQASQQENISKETGQIVVKEEPLPLNDPFVGDSSFSGGVKVISEDESSLTKKKLIDFYCFIWPRGRSEKFIF